MNDRAQPTVACTGLRWALRIIGVVAQRSVAPTGEGPILDT